MSTISSSTTSTTAYKVTADTTGTLVLQTGATPTTAVTIDTSQNVGIGTSSPGYKFVVKQASGDLQLAMQGAVKNWNFRNQADGTFGYYDDSLGSWRYYYDTNNNHIWFNGTNTERMRIDSSGNLLVGTTNTSATAGAGMKFSFADPANPLVKNVVADSSGAYSTWNLYSTNASAYRFFVTTAGIVNATTTTITAISDQRLKENIRDLDDGLEKVLALKPRKFDWKENKGENIKNARGFIAQELELVFPDMVTNWIDEPPEGEEPYKAVNANLIPTLVKAIQEQQALIQQLQTDVAALKGAST